MTRLHDMTPAEREARECALWVWHHHSLYYDICRNELDAARLALAIEDDGSGSVAGVQFDDGEFIDSDAWPVYDAEQKRQQAEWKAEFEGRKNDPPRPTREITAPFGKGHTVKVPLDAPEWLGARAPGADIIKLRGAS